MPYITPRTSKKKIHNRQKIIKEATNFYIKLYTDYSHSVKTEILALTSQIKSLPTLDIQHDEVIKTLISLKENKVAGLEKIENSLLKILADTQIFLVQLKCQTLKQGVPSIIISPSSIAAGAFGLSVSLMW